MHAGCIKPVDQFRCEGENLDRHVEFTCCLLVGQDTLENEMSSSQEGLLVK